MDARETPTPMIATCPSCAVRYLVDTRALGATGRLVRCGLCAHMWLQEPAERTLRLLDFSPAAAAPGEAAWSERLKRALSVVGEQACGASERGAERLCELLAKELPSSGRGTPARRRARRSDPVTAPRRQRRAPRSWGSVTSPPGEAVG